MNKQIPSMGSPWRTPSTFCILGLTILLSSCASTPSRFRHSSSPRKEDSRSQLVLLNLQEASGWVAYNCNPDGESTETEDYRVVVIRQKSGEVIYDSQIPLPANLCTHGFEMAPNDPRLKKLGRNVDSDIIAPLEAYQQTMKEKAAHAASESESSAKPQTNSDSDSDLKAETPVVAEAAVEADVTKSASETEETPSITISGKDGEAVLLTINHGTAPMLGDRFFLRTHPKVIAIPGTDEKIISSEGEIKGLVQIESVDDGSARAKLLSGSVPESGFAEAVKKP